MIEAPSPETPAIVYAGLGAIEQAASEPEQAAAVAALIHQVFDSYYTISRAIPERAKQAFETQDWIGSIALSHERLAIYRDSAVALAGSLKFYCPENDRYWNRVQDEFLARIAGIYQADLAFAFLNSVRRQINQDQWKASEYHTVNRTLGKSQFTSRVRSCHVFCEIRGMD